MTGGVKKEVMQKYMEYRSKIEVCRRIHLGSCWFDEHYYIPFAIMKVSYIEGRVRGTIRGRR